MNDVLQNVMLFINEHTLLLIGICVFLILVLIGYLIDNSVKSKRIRNDIKNKDQVPENIKDEIIKEAEDKKIIKEDTNVEIKPENNISEAVNVEAPSESAIETPVIPSEPVADSPEVPTINVEEPVNNVSLDAENQSNLNDTILATDVSIPNLNEPLTFDTVNQPNVQETYKDPDLDIMNQNVKSEYSNDKGLSEILLSLKNEEPTSLDNNVVNLNEVPENNDTIFTTDSPNIVINNDVKKDDVQIQKEESSDELDRIMRKLSTMNNNVEDDNYTNIF